MTLDAGGVRSLPLEEIAIILRGADELIMSGGRTMLAKVLKGSREKKLLELGLDRSPAYGALEHCKSEEIAARIDWVIAAGYLAIEYEGRLPLLVYTERGWAIERETYTAETLARLDEIIASGAPPRDLGWLNEVNRQVVLQVLERIEASGDPKYLPLLEAWSSDTFKKVRQRIHRVVNAIRAGGG